MRLAIMQPYLFPYIGYFQLISAVDLFVVYDNIKYTKKGWINRNRMLQNGKDVLFSLPLKNASDSLDVKDRELAADFRRSKLLNRLKEAYRRSPYFERAFPVVEEVIQNTESNLFRFVYNSIGKVCEYLGIDTKTAISSSLQIDHSLKNQDKVIAICKAVGANQYINAIGGMDLYVNADFRAKEIELKFLKSKPFEYKQFSNNFVPGLSVVDVMMFNSVDTIRECLKVNYELI